MYHISTYIYIYICRYLCTKKHVNIKNLMVLLPYKWYMNACYASTQCYECSTQNRNGFAKLFAKYLAKYYDLHLIRVLYIFWWYSTNLNITRGFRSNRFIYEVGSSRITDEKCWTVNYVLPISIYRFLHGQNRNKSHKKKLTHLYKYLKLNR